MTISRARHYATWTAVLCWAAFAASTYSAQCSLTVLSEVAAGKLRGGQCPTNGGQVCGSSACSGTEINCGDNEDWCFYLDENGNEQAFPPGTDCGFNPVIENATGAPQCQNGAATDQCMQQGKNTILCLDYSNCYCYTTQPGDGLYNPAFGPQTGCFTYDNDPNDDNWVNSCYSN